MTTGVAPVVPLVGQEDPLRPRSHIKLVSYGQAIPRPVSYVSQDGFTLFELVIVLVIAALLLAAILQASSMRKEAYLKDLVSTVKDLSEATRAFKERYHYLPGDLRRASDDLPLSPTETAVCGLLAGSYAGNGLINLQTDPQAGYTETNCAPLHLARAGLIREDASPIVRNFGDAHVSIEFMSRGDSRPNSVSSYPTTYPTSVQNVLQLKGVPYSLAVRLDDILDDGDLDRGKVRACDTSNNPIVPPQNRVPPEDQDTPVPYLVVPLL